MIPITSTEQAIEIGKSITAADLGELRREADNIRAKLDLAMAQATIAHDKEVKKAFHQVAGIYSTRLQFLKEALITAVDTLRPRTDNPEDKAFLAQLQAELERLTE